MSDEEKHATVWSAEVLRFFGWLTKIVVVHPRPQWSHEENDYSSKTIKFTVFHWLFNELKFAHTSYYFSAYDYFCDLYTALLDKTVRGWLIQIKAPIHWRRCLKWQQSKYFLPINQYIKSTIPPPPSPSNLRREVHLFIIVVEEKCTAW